MSERHQVDQHDQDHDHDDDGEAPPPGSILWLDLTVSDATEIRDFYKSVIGWESEPVPMGDYEDFDMIDAQTGDPMVGICHARGENAGIPAQWLVYLAVENLDQSVERCVALGGSVLNGPKEMGAGRVCVIRDPAGAVAALFEAGEEEEDDDEGDDGEE